MEAKAVKRKSTEAVAHGDEKKQKPTSGISINLSAKPAVPKVNLVSTTTTPKVNMTKKLNPIAMKLGAQKPKETEPLAPVKSTSVAAAFNEDSDEDVEEMPKSAKMRMKNIGRDTPTSAGPKSFNKTKTGFQNTARNWERHLDEIGKQDHAKNS
ncbi:PEST proteolytic signal-containing nuclear protein-like [Anneissia japonica]|uniref:PEST proteolytic signal-containing nuclear protein-like n=1 Tax=Anneissia japonica TaxID=1529436 RepID=UPI001425B462|nr:PEST proteolytic signal-containing nuclear protein-like [Anneissia japonica]XP_033111845.1 PEST proteolytic signal-containing nuclear protein-like [Anneissia japonica]XP_033111846.1 PEST proteolytic signal-containing nuclear protein-like [Anneissia japonica]